MVVIPGIPGRWSGFDLETTGVDPTTARIVTASLVFFQADRPTVRAQRNWLVDPGIPIPDEAAAVHGVTTERARAQGRPACAAVAEILEQVDRVWRSGVPMVVFNAPYDLTVMNAEAARHGFPPLSARAGWRRAVILDPLVIDRRVDRYRPGRRTLQASAEHYGVAAGRPHSSDGDAAAACLVAGRSRTGSAGSRASRRCGCTWCRSVGTGSGPPGSRSTSEPTVVRMRWSTPTGRLVRGHP